MNREAITSTLSEERICSFSFEDLIYEEKEKDSLSIRDENSSEKSLANSSLDCSSSFTGLNILNDSSASNTNFLKNLGKLLRTWVRVSGLEKSTNQKAK